jgi:glycine/D-amino acid oxidase-like deaminating enzyme
MTAQRVSVVGTGIVGGALARELAAASSVEATVLEASAEGQVAGSTG